MSAQPQPYLTPEEYLAIERKAEFKSEYFQGEMFAMSGASLAHNQIVANLMIGIGSQLQKRSCRIFNADMRVEAKSNDAYYYPDVVALCGEPKLKDHHQDILLNPMVLIEVLSPSTESYDRGLKRETYAQLESLRDYVLVAQDRMHVEHLALQEDRRWVLTDLYLPEETLVLESVQAELTLAEIYDNVEFPELQETA